ncbi:terminal quinol oxidase subunit [Haloferax elongans ATCC BAA-1513]|uniref:Terminal quinol oxidase subunit n=1 Tax=Haloferax elongans ATCC BAA-1513 TaxID=1230453 RepID=M0HQN6_HALEO|nr:DoxX family protein [Haloferax elongans]ELZ86043.1 terminal quinol oxidase subunit [Haloferax elongans ATCC BAA-1513]
MSVPVQFASPTADIAFLLARVLFGAVIAFMGLNHFMNTDQMAGYAEMKGLPAPRLGVVFSGGMLAFGGLGIAAGVLPALAAGAIILFLLVSTPMFHNFWAVPEEQQESEMTSFLKNVVMLGGALVFLALSTVSWPYAIGLTMF